MKCLIYSAVLLDYTTDLPVGVARVNLLLQRTDAGECDRVAKTRIDDDEAGFLRIGLVSGETGAASRPQGVWR